MHRTWKEVVAAGLLQGPRCAWGAAVTARCLPQTTANEGGESVRDSWRPRSTDGGNCDFCSTQRSRKVAAGA
ncbi:hypothetical protein NDU88_003172 [Pleurodeles waltl]|uniref:Secreted protein n=1 Tax=Pleurodeles waltl TaxID=8319 RepID=A0AAV7UCM0_PLEWA|nr:hypothetical protein NDU88_003172 [Pleurodeles waltl]